MKRNGSRKEFLIPSDLTCLPRASRQVLSFLAPLGLGEATLFDVRLCLEEGLINAIKYGHRLRKRLEVRLAVEYDHSKLKIQIDDQGEGFDVKRLEDCTQGRNLSKGSGRGVYLIRQLMDEVHYNEKGNRLSMVKYLT